MRKTVSDHKADLINDLIAARQELLVEINRLPSGKLGEPFLGVWCAKDLIAHLVGWDFTNLQAVQEILAGKRPSFFQFYDRDWQSYNARVVTTHRVEPWEALLAKAADSHQQLVSFLQALPAKAIVQGKSPKEQGRTVSIHNLLAAEAKDERAHAQQVRAFYERVIASPV